MIDGLGRVQTVLLIGGTSDIGLAAATELLADGGRLLLAGRDPQRLAAAARAVTAPRRVVDTLPYEADDPVDGIARVLTDAAESAGDLDVVLICLGVLGDQDREDADTPETARSLRTNMLAPAVAAHAAARRLARQGHGTVVVLSSVAALRPRRAILAYSAAKAGLDAYAAGLNETLHGTGARVMVVRPGQVRTRMTAGLADAPFTVDAADVAVAIRRGLRRGADIVYVPGILRPVMGVLRMLPAPVFRRITARGAP